MRTSELLRATRKRFDERVAEARERNDRLKKAGAAAELIDVGHELREALWDVAGGLQGFAQVEEAERILEGITSPLWCEAMRLFDGIGPNASIEEWKKVREASFAAQRDVPLRDWLAAEGRSAVEVQTVLTRAFARAVKAERENG